MSQFYQLSISQNEEIPNCCFATALVPERAVTPSFLKQYSHSHGKSKDRKINVITAKKGHSQEKITGISLSKNLKGKGVSSMKMLNTLHDGNGTTTLGSKMTSKIQSVSSSRLRLDQARIEQPAIRETKQLQCFPLKSQITFQQTRADVSNLHLLSDITMVEEEFISHGSTTLNALNCITQGERSRINERENITIKMLNNFSYPSKADVIRQSKNPLERLTDRNRKGNERKKLVL